MPDDLNDVSSYCSPKFPIVIMDESKVASGIARGTVLADAKNNNCVITKPDKPFPTKSSTYTHRNCMMSTNSVTKNVMMNGGMNDLSKCTSILFTPNIRPSELKNPDGAA